jgi:serine/threonine protein kinase
LTNERTTGSQTIPSSDHRRYRILGVLGHGGFGTVYHARMEGSDGFVKEVAIKLLSDPNPAPETLSRFRDEARILGLLRDRSIPSVDPPTRLQGRWAVVMEFVDGMDCRRALREHGRLPPTVALGIVEEVARTLHNLWNHPGEDGKPMCLLHRDLKPSNLQLTPNGDVKVLDFGVARAEFDMRESTTSANIAGTRGYIAPERLEGVEDPRGDVYSLGVVLEELVTGLRPSLLDAPTPSGAGGSPLPGFAGVPPDVLVLARSMREPLVESRPTADQVERRCAELARQLEGPSLRDWSRTCVSRNMGREPDGLVGQTLSHTLPRISYDSPPSTATDRRWTVLTLMLGAVAATVALLVVLVGVGSLGALWFVSSRPPVVTLEPLAPIEPLEPQVDQDDGLANTEPPLAAEPTPGPTPGSTPGSAPTTPTPAPTNRKKPKPKPPPPPATGTVSQSGADSIELVSDAGRFRTGKVPVGRYSVFALFAGQPEVVPAGTIELEAGERVELRCDARFKRCISQ